MPAHHYLPLRTLIKRQAFPKQLRTGGDYRKLYDAISLTVLPPLSVAILGYMGYKWWKYGPEVHVYEKSNASDFKLTVHGPGSVMREK